MESRIVRLREEPKKKSNRKRKKSTSKRKSTRKRANDGSRIVRLRETPKRSSSRSTRTAKKATNKATKKRPSRKRKTASRTRATSKRRKTRKSKKWIQQAVPPSRRGKFKEWCKRKGYKGVNQRCINEAIREGGHPAKMAQFAINVSRGKYRRPSTPKRRSNPKPRQEDAVLIDQETGMTVGIGDEVTSFRGEKAYVTGWQAPSHEGSTGRVYVKTEEGYEASYFPSVYNLKIQYAQRNPGGEQFVGKNGTVIQPIQYF